MFYVSGFIRPLAQCLRLKQHVCFSKQAAVALRNKKAKSEKNTVQYFVDVRKVLALGGKGGDGAISFLHLWCNEDAGPDGGDGGNGGHIILQATSGIRDLNHVASVLQANPGEKGYNKDCHGKNADHTVVKVPIGTVIKSESGKVVGDLKSEGAMFLAARGGAGGHGNHFFISNAEQAPQVAEYGAVGESRTYVLEIRSMAHIGLIGFPNAGKSTLLRAISRARPKVASYPFTTLKPHLGVVQYDDYEQIAVADLPGLIAGSHLNKGLGITFLKHVERCTALLYVIDVSCANPWVQVESLQYEMKQFNADLLQRPQLIVANKIDLPEAESNLKLLEEQVSIPIIPISAKMGTNVSLLLEHIREIYDNTINFKEDTSE